MAGGALESGRSVTSKVTAILMVFSRGSDYSLTELARLTGLPISTTHRLVGELTSRRLLERTEDGGYRIGLPLRMIGSGTAEAPPLLEPARRSWRTWPRSPARRCASACCRACGSPMPRRVPAPRRRQRSAATLLPPHATALGRVLLAFSPAAVLDAVVAAGLPSLGASTPTTPERLRRSLAVIRLTRIAVSPGESRRGPAAVAMPVFGAGGEVLAALELVVSNPRVRAAQGPRRVGGGHRKPVAAAGDGARGDTGRGDRVRRRLAEPRSPRAHRCHYPDRERRSPRCRRPGPRGRAPSRAAAGPGQA